MSTSFQYWLCEPQKLHLHSVLSILVLLLVGDDAHEWYFVPRWFLGAMATIVTHPFDTVKSIRQVQLGSQTKPSSEHTLQLLRQMFQRQGLQGWYKGKSDPPGFSPILDLLPRFGATSVESLTGMCDHDFNNRVLSWACVHSDRSGHSILICALLEIFCFANKRAFFEQI